jgi:hypothetical protein
MPDANIFKTEFGNYRRRGRVPNLIEGATVILFGGKKLVGAYLRNVRRTDDGRWIGERMHAKIVRRWCSNEILRVEPVGTEVVFGPWSVWLAFRPEIVGRVDTPSDGTAVTQVM